MRIPVARRRTLDLDLKILHPPLTPKKFVSRLQATLHAHVGGAVHDQQLGGGEEYLARVGGVATWHPAWVIWLARTAAAYGPATIVLLVRPSYLHGSAG